MFHILWSSWPKISQWLWLKMHIWNLICRLDRFKDIRKQFIVQNLGRYHRYLKLNKSKFCYEYIGYLLCLNLMCFKFTWIFRVCETNLLHQNVCIFVRIRNSWIVLQLIYYQDFFVAEQQFCTMGVSFFQETVWLWVCLCNSILNQN